MSERDTGRSPKDAARAGAGASGRANDAQHAGVSALHAGAANGDGGAYVPRRNGHGDGGPVDATDTDGRAWP
jgi:hypothetical protein